MKKTVLLSLLSALFFPLAAAELGSPAPEIQITEIVKGKGFTLAELKGKKFVVIHFWGTQCPPCDEAVGYLQEYSKKFTPRDVEFIAIAGDDASTLRKSRKLTDYPCPIGADGKLDTVNAYLRPGDRLPTDAVIGKDGRLLWIGPSLQLGEKLEAILTGQYDLEAAIDFDTFDRAVSEAYRKRDYDSALSLFDARLKRFPDDTQLTVARCNLLAGAFKTPEKALADLDAAIARKPKEFALYETKLTLLARRGDSDKALDATYADIARNFADQPLLLLHLAEVLMRKPVGSFHLASVYKLARTAYDQNTLTAKVDRGRAAAVLARFYYYVGMPEKSLKYQKEAYAGLKGTNQEKRAKTDLDYYYNAVSVGKEVERLEAGKD